jgi:L-malate glycosyltransferase
MRIALLTPYTEPVKGGISAYVRELFDAYKQMGHEVTGLAAEGRSGPRFMVPARSRIAFSIRAFLLLATDKPDLIHSHSHWHVLVPGFLLRKVNRRARLLFTFHTMPQTDTTSVGSRILRWMLRSCDGVTFVSGQLQDALHVRGSQRQEVIHPAPEREALSLLRVTRGTANPTVVFVGPLVWPQKVAGVERLVEAFGIIAATYPQWRLSVVGDGPFRAPVEAKARRLGLLRQVDFPGQVENGIDSIAGAEVYAHISLQEGLPLSLLNAMALGKPVLAAAVGGMREVIIDGVTGRLVPPSVEAIAAALSDLLSDEGLRRRLGEAARSWVSKELSWETVASRHIELVMGT